MALRPEQKKRLLALFGIPIALAVVLAIAAAGKQTFGGATGERCEDLSGCKFGNVCIAHKCYVKCKSTADCPAQMHCGKTSVTVVTQGTFTQDERAGTEQICFPNAPASSRPSS